MGKSKVKYQGISTLEVLVEAKNYNKWIADQIGKHVKGKTLEIGAGTGNLSQFFTHHKNLHLSEYDQALVKELQKKFALKKQIVVNQLDITKKPSAKFIKQFNTIYAINVLEHIEDDAKAFKNINQMLDKNGKLLLLVPAKKIAYTKLDKELGHFRRYEKEELKTKLEKAGFTIDELYFFNIVGLVSWIIRNKIKRSNVELKPYHIRLFDSIVPLLRVIENKIKMPVGISLIAIASKK